MTLKNRRKLQNVLFVYKSIHDLIEIDIFGICYRMPYVRHRRHGLVQVLAAERVGYIGEIHQNDEQNL